MRCVLVLLFTLIISLYCTQTCAISKWKFSNPAFVNVRERLNMIHPLWRTMVNFPLILLNAELKVQCIVLVLGKDTTEHCNAAPLMAKEWARGNSSRQLWIGMFSGLGVNVLKQVSQNYGKSELVSNPVIKKKSLLWPIKCPLPARLFVTAYDVTTICSFLIDRTLPHTEMGEK